jgi:hypothetical protein
MPISAPRNDLAFMKSLTGYANQTVAHVASEKFGNHLWYLSEELISLAFFDESVSTETKRKMKSSLKVSMF